MDYKKGGFSLIELLLVLGVSAILMGIAGVSFANQRKNSNLSRAVQSLSQDIKFTRSKAISSGTSWRLKSNGIRSYTIEALNEDSGDWEHVKSKTLTRGAEFISYEEGELEFDTRGYMNIDPPDFLFMITNSQNSKIIYASMTGSLVVSENSN